MTSAVEALEKAARALARKAQDRAIQADSNFAALNWGSAEEYANTYFHLYLEDAEVAIAALAPTVSDDGWREIDSAPRDGTPILIVHADGHIGLATLRDDSLPDLRLVSENQAWAGLRSGDRWPAVWLGGYRATEASHWRPLPPPPAKPAPDGGEVE